MEDGPARRAITVVLLYFMTTASLWAEETLLERLKDPKDWIVGSVVGVLGGLAVLLVLSFRVPHLRINRSIVIRRGDTDGSYRSTIQVLNKRRYWWIVTGDAIDIRAELHVVTRYDRGKETTKKIPMAQSNPLIIPHKRRFSRLAGSSEYLFDVTKQADLKKALTGGVAIRFRLYARDSFSNYGRIFTRYYRNKDKLRWWERLIRFLRREPLEPIITGDYKAPGDRRIDPD
jgi:hypothetical protein